MLVEVENKNKIVKNAFCTINNHSVSLHINTLKKYASYECVISSDDKDGNYYNKYIFYLDDKLDKFDSVKVTAESEEEKNALQDIPFECNDKDQIWILFVEDDVYKIKENK